MEWSGGISGLKVAAGKSEGFVSVAQASNGGSAPSSWRYCPVQSLEMAREWCRQAWQRREAVLVTGPAGIGKTLLLRLLLMDLPATAPRCLVPYGWARDAAELHQAMLFDLGRSYRGQSAQELRLSVWDAVLSLEQPLLLLIDDAYHLAKEALEELALLTNLSVRGEPALVPVLAGPPSLENLLREAAVLERLAVCRCRLEPWSAEESRTFLRWRWQQTVLPIEEEAMQLLVDHGAGLARRLLRLSALAEQLAMQAGAANVDAEAVWEAIVMEGQTVPPTPQTTSSDAQPQAVGGDTEQAISEISKDQVLSPERTKESIPDRPGCVPVAEAA